MDNPKVYEAASIAMHSNQQALSYGVTGPTIIIGRTYERLFPAGHGRPINRNNNISPSTPPVGKQIDR